MTRRATGEPNRGWFSSESAVAAKARVGTPEAAEVREARQTLLRSRAAARHQARLIRAQADAERVAREVARRARLERIIAEARIYVEEHRTIFE